MIVPKYLLLTPVNTLPGTVLNTGNLFSDRGRHLYGNDNLMEEKFSQQIMTPKNDLQITNTRKDVEKREPACTCQLKYKLVQPLRRTLWRFLKKLKVELPYDPAIPLLGIYPEKTIVQKDTYTPMFIAELFIIAKTWKKPKCPSKDEWIKMMWYICTIEYYSAIKKNKMKSYAATLMDLEIIILNEVSQKEKEKHHMISHICRI